MSGKKRPKAEDGGWVPPNTKEFHAFWTRVQKQADQLFGTDNEGSSVVIVDMTDRSRYEHNSLLPVPLRIKDNRYHPYNKEKWSDGKRDSKTKKFVHPVHTPEEEAARITAITENDLERLRMVAGNVDIVQGCLRQVHFDFEFDLRDKLKTAENADKQVKF